MSIVITGHDLTIEHVVAVARDGAPVALDSAAVARIERCREMLERKIRAREIMYGVNTGIGELSEIVLTPQEVEQFQRYLIYNHAAGYGEPFPGEVVRAAMVSRINVHAHGHSGCRAVIPATLVEMLNRGVTPVVCQHGSVGACGDLAPMSQMALVAMGEGEAYFQGARYPGRVAMDKAGIPTVTLQARDGLSMINGSNFVAGMGALLVHDVERWLKQADIAAAMTLEALIANMKPYDPRLHELRGFRGAVASAANIRRCIEGSDLLGGKKKVKVQDAYSMRSTPQVIGAARDHLRWTRSQIEIELSGVGDNPIFLPDDDTVLTGANFQGTPISLPLDLLGAAVCMISVLSERRLNRLLHPALSVGLPAFLTRGAGMFSGLMLSQYTADMLIVDQRIQSMPASIQSIPAAADQEDFVSMGMNTAHKTRRILEHAHAVLGIELLAGAQALDLRDFEPGRGTRAAHAEVRRHVAHLDEDRPLFPDHNAIARAVKECRILAAVEAEIGALETY
ncbi:MAG: aromatic amino acid lyase [Planctomycetes bacterium]|nr:aromatic amino acid lyase [Planctomycetota bacterium]